MSNRLIEPISPNTTITKPRLVTTINNAIDEINKINELYERLFTAAAGDKQSIATEIEAELKQIKAKYLELFDGVGTGTAKVEILDKKIAEIEDYHQKLILADDSIQVDIKDSQDKITDFYVELFQTYETKGDGGQKAKLEAAFKSIISFDEELNKADVGHRAKIENAKVDILAAYDDLFTKDKKTNKNKIDLLNEHITEANEFHENLTDNITPYIAEKQKEMDDVAADISVKQAEVDSLLSKTTISTLSQGYLEAMQIYGDPIYAKLPHDTKGKLAGVIRNIFRALKHLAKFVGAYTLFIGPLLIIGLVFATNWAQDIFNFDANGNVQFSGTEYIFYKLTIALPLLWVSWYGQKSISHRKRLFEEYNHKLRVVQMYLQFITKNDTFVLSSDAQRQMEVTLLDSVERNPSEVYGKDETFLDKVLELASLRKEAKAEKNANKKK